MTNVTRRSTRRVGSGVAALVGLSAVALATPLSANAAPGLELTRVGGESRYQTAAQVSAENFPDGQSQTVVLASGTSTVDALASAFVAGANDAPVLLTEPGALPGATAAELERLGAERVILAGGDAVISPAVEDLLAEDYAVQRAAGGDRYETAALLAGTVEDANPDVVFVAAGAVDAATVSPVSAALGWPVLLTARDAVPEATERALAAYPDAEVVVLGGESAISEETATELGAGTRIEGSDRYETATKIAQFAVEEAGFTGTGFGVAVGRNGANGDDLADALTAGPALARMESPLLLAEGVTTLGAATQQYLEENSDQFTGKAVVFGGRAVVSDEVVQTIADVTETTAPEVPAPDTTAPNLQSSSIRDGATGVPVGANLDLAFSEVLSASATTVALLDVGNANAPVAGTTTFNGATLSFNPSTNLALGGSYVAVVQARDLAGNATAEIRIAFTTATSAPGAPTALTAGATAGTTQALSWTAPASDGGSIITGYTVNVYAGPAATGTPAQTVPAAGTSTTVTGLTPGTEYTYTVVATNATGTSAESSSVTETTFDVPGAPTSLALGAVGGTTQALTWVAPTSDGGSAVTDYTVNVYAGSSATGTPRTEAASGTSTTITGLTPGTPYTYTVVANNVVGASAASNSVTGATVIPVDLQSAAFTNDYASNDAFSHVDDSITLTFDAPVVVSGSVTGFFSDGSNPEIAINFYVGTRSASDTLLVEYGGPPQVSSIAGRSVRITGGVFDAANPTVKVADTAVTIS
ncbi:cell wall-binding repeat-containing protein [Kineococcus sp. SYSU DK003]|uniref:cell wall-binding repeat-containing protein n=1 Tax=Kineococcus sp. SYSU DK003 TaxID=3383124 RepID=UPI003D7E98BC